MPAPTIADAMRIGLASVMLVSHALAEDTKSTEPEDPGPSEHPTAKASTDAAAPSSARPPSPDTRNSTRLVGTLTRIDGKTLTIVSTNREAVVTCTDETRISRAGDLKSMPPVTFDDLQVGLPLRVYYSKTDNRAFTVIITRPASSTSTGLDGGIATNDVKRPYGTPSSKSGYSPATTNKTKSPSSTKKHKTHSKFYRKYEF